MSALGTRWRPWVDGAPAESTATATIEVRNPATGELLGEVPAGTAADADAAIRSSQTAFRAWRRTPAAERARLQHAAAALVREHADELGRILTLELGRPLAAARTEILRSADLLGFFAEEGLRLQGEVPLLEEADERVMVVKEPLGVVVAIAPFNFPITLLTFKLGAALITGNTVVAKPAADTPLSTLRLAELFTQAGFPPGVFNVVTGHGRELGEALVSHPVPAKVGFTGSTRAGVRIHQLAAVTNKRITLELGGQCPAILFDDADLDVAVPAIVKHAYANSGQFCYRVNRVYVHEDRYGEFLDRFAAGVRELVVGDGMDPATDLGPLVSERILATSVEQVADARAKGARVLCGGERLTGEPFDAGPFFAPTVIADATHDMLVMTEETFGPVVGVGSFADDTEALAKANDTPYGLAAYVFSDDLRRAWRAAEELEAGSVWVNNIHRSLAQVPFGGMKQSGLGREKSKHGLDEYVELKTIYLGM
ncbi:MAG: Aldehyde dehydrogenase [uncultured Thermoleophilia bacterium]|uniref:Aldehyde dehydrogenase n=1 Tax=uncultured Thermoleophilia bacterium TaxID=1497501 RepID=A0A6J4TFT8_9ACTN|nr:MAG: Aldehyde dehydrogenase [uncultured Thermoleophilia bacterium]